MYIFLCQKGISFGIFYYISRYSNQMYSYSLLAHIAIKLSCVATLAPVDLLGIHFLYGSTAYSKILILRELIRHSKVSFAS